MSKYDYTHNYDPAFFNLDSVNNEIYNVIYATMSTTLSLVLSISNMFS